MGANAEILEPEALGELADLPIKDRNERLLSLARDGKFDFVDLGTHRGGGIRWGQHLGGGLGLGIELDPKRAHRALKAGYPVYTGDIAAFPSEGLRFRFAVCRHVLEHMPNEYVVGFVLWRLAQMCTEFIYIEQPIFDYAAELGEQGLTLAHLTMSAHTCRLSIDELLASLERIGLPNYVQGRMRPIRDSSHPWVHAADAPRDRSRWQEGIDPPRPEVKFEPPLHRDLVVIASLGHLDVEGILSRLKGFDLERSMGHRG
ncbi:MAG TPA: hypothetical protein VIY71_01675 [Solirubrobacterales bacterium]